MVDRSITLLKVAMMGELRATAVAFAAGMVELTTGGMAAAVVKVHEWFMARLAPVEDMAPVVIMAVKTLLGTRGLEGVKVAVRPSVLVVTAPATGVIPWASVKVVPLRGAIGVLKTAEGVTLGATLVAPSAGERVLIKGAFGLLGHGFLASFPLQANRARVTRETP